MDGDRSLGAGQSQGLFVIPGNKVAHSIKGQPKGLKQRNDQLPQTKTLPSFLITIDTEGDNLWARRKVITTKNSLFLHRFQARCESFGLGPTYLTNYEMASCPIFSGIW